MSTWGEACRHPGGRRGQEQRKKVAWRTYWRYKLIGVCKCAMGRELHCAGVQVKQRYYQRDGWCLKRQAVAGKLVVPALALTGRQT